MPRKVIDFTLDPKKDYIFTQNGDYTAVDTYVGNEFFTNGGLCFLTGKIYSKPTNAGSYRTLYEVEFTATGHKKFSELYMLRKGAVRDPYALTYFAKACAGIPITKGTSAIRVYLFWHELLVRSFDYKQSKRYMRWGRIGIELAERLRCYEVFEREWIERYGNEYGFTKRVKLGVDRDKVLISGVIDWDNINVEFKA